MKRLRAIWSNDEGATLVEYVLLISLFVIVCVAAIKVFGTWTSTSLNSAGTSL
jgi:Flp pilus assembly pilin Flp